MNWRNFLLGIFYSALPRSYRGRWQSYSTVDFRRSAVVSGLIELLICGFFCVARYKDFLLMRARHLSVLRGTNEGTQLYMTGILTVEYLLQPLTIILVYCVAEGAIRSLAAWVGDEILPVTPLKLIQVFQQWIGRRRTLAGYGPLVPDVVERVIDSSFQLKITSCRPKEGWRESVTIVFEERLYDLVRVEQTPPPYRFIYYLQQKPEGTIVRGIYHYMS